MNKSFEVISVGQDGLDAPNLQDLLYLKLQIDCKNHLSLAPAN